MKCSVSVLALFVRITYPAYVLQYFKYFRFRSEKAKKNSVESVVWFETYFFSTPCNINYNPRILNRRINVELFFKP